MKIDLCLFYSNIFILTGYILIVRMGCYEGQAGQDQGQQLHHHRQHLLIKVEDLRSLETGLHLPILC